MDNDTVWVVIHEGENEFGNYRDLCYICNTEDKANQMKEGVLEDISDDENCVVEKWNITR